MGCVASTPANPTSSSSSSHPSDNPARQSQNLSKKKHGITAIPRSNPSGATTNNSDDKDPVKPTSKRSLRYRHHPHPPNDLPSSLGPRHLDRGSASSSRPIDPAAVAPDDNVHDDAVDNDSVVVTIGPPPPGVADASHRQATSKTNSSKNNNNNRFSKSSSAAAAFASFDNNASVDHPAMDTASTTSTMSLSQKVPVPVQARIAKFNEMDDVAIVLGPTEKQTPASTAASTTPDATASVVANGSTPNSTLSSLQMSSSTFGVQDNTATTKASQHKEGQEETAGEGEGEDGHVMEQSKSASTIKSETPGTVAPIMIGAISRTNSTGALQKNAIYERIVDFERQAEETERLKTLVHKPKHEFKHGADIQLHQLERPRVFSSTAVATT